MAIEPPFTVRVNLTGCSPPRLPLPHPWVPLPSMISTTAGGRLWSIHPSKGPSLLPTPSCCCQSCWLFWEGRGWAGQEGAGRVLSNALFLVRVPITQVGLPCGNSFASVTIGALSRMHICMSLKTMFTQKPQRSGLLNTQDASVISGMPTISRRKEIKNPAPMRTPDPGTQLRTVCPEGGLF